MKDFASQLNDTFRWARDGRGMRASDISLWLLLAAVLILRVLNDDLSAPTSRHSGNLNLSALIAVLLIVIAAGTLGHWRRGALPTALILLWLAVWMVIAMHTNGASTETLREGVREISVVAVAVLVYNARGAFSIPVAVRLVQCVAFIPAIIALHQLATGTGVVVAHHIRANGTLAHPNSAAMVFALAAAASAWRAADRRLGWVDLVCVLLFGAATLATVSIDGAASLAIMLLTLGVFQRSARQRIVLVALAFVVVGVFFLSPLGSERVSQEYNTNLAAAGRGEIDSSLDTRLYRWKTLLPVWEESPVLGHGLGTTTTTEGTAENHLAGLLPHNEYIRYLVETGVVGSLILLGGLVALIRALWGMGVGSDDRDGPWRSARGLGFAVLIGCLLNSAADNTLLNSPTCYIAAVLIAAVLASRDVSHDLGSAEARLAV